MSKSPHAGKELNAIGVRTSRGRRLAAAGAAAETPAERWRSQEGPTPKLEAVRGTNVAPLGTLAFRVGRRVRISFAPAGSLRTVGSAGFSRPRHPRPARPQVIYRSIPYASEEGIFDFLLPSRELDQAFREFSGRIRESDLWLTFCPAPGARRPLRYWRRGGLPVNP